MENLIYTAIGTLGAAIILILFVLNQINKIDKGSVGYDFWNLVGGALLVVYSFLIESYPFLVLNLVWTLVSLKDVLAGLNKN